MSEDDQCLAAFARDGSESAFRRLVERHLQLVYGVALRMVNGDVHQAQDIAQAVFANLARKAASIPPGFVLAGWLHRDARFTALEWLRQERRRLDRERDAAAFREPRPEPEVDWTRVRPLLDEALDSLEDADRHVLLLRFLEGLSHSEVGRALGIAEEAARKRAVRALDALRRAFAARGLNSSTEALEGTFSVCARTVAPAALAATIAGSVPTGVAAATAAAAGPLAALPLLTMTKLHVGLLGVLGVVTLTIPLAIQHQTTAGLRRENAALRQQVADRDTLAAENRRLTARLNEAETRRPSDPPARELMRLRGEMGVLRQQNQELSRLLAQARSRTAQPPADYEPSSAWSNTGTGTPEAAAGTFAWAVKTGSAEALADVLVLPEEVGTNTAEFLDAMSLVLQPAILKIEGSRLVSTETLASDEVALLFENRLTNGGTELSPLTLKQVDGQWRVKLPFVVNPPPGALESP